MNYRKLGKTGLNVSEIGFGGEWIERHNQEETNALFAKCESEGINIFDCWMSNPDVRSKIGNAIKGHREKWFIQGHIGSTWQNGQYERTRELSKVKVAFEDLLNRLGTDYIDLGMIHFIDSEKEFDDIFTNGFYDYVKSLKEQNIIHHIGLSTHNPSVAKKAVLSGSIEMMLFSINPAFDMLPPSEDLNTYFAEEYDSSLGGINKERAELYNLCETHGVGITVMKGFAGGRLFNEKASPFGVKLTPIQCLHYSLTRPAVASVMVGYDTTAHIEDAVSYESATEQQKDYSTILANAPRHAYQGQCTYCNHCKPCPSNIDIAMVNKYYDLATMQNDLPESVLSHYKALENNADDCIGCGQCETRCPFGVHIVEMMSKAKELFSNR